MKPIMDKTGSQVTAIGEYDIATGTNIGLNTVVKISSGKVVAAAVGETTAILGSAAETHTGAADAFNVRNNGLKIKVYDSPSQVFSTTAPRLTATGGTTTTLIVNNATLATFVDSDFVGGYFVLASKGATSTNTDGLGTVYPCTAFTAATKVFTTTQTAGGAITAGDIFEIYPPVGFAKGNLASTLDKYDLSATAALAIKTVGFDTSKGTVQVEATLHQNANKQS